MTDPVWVLADPRPGTAAQAFGIADRLGVPYRTVPLEWGMLAGLPLSWPTLAGLAPVTRANLAPPWPRLVLSAGRRAAPVARWLRRQGAKTVHCMRPGFGAADFDLLVIGRHDEPAESPSILPILGACHRLTPAHLAEARAGWPDLAELPSPRVALLVGGPVQGEGLDPATAAGLGVQVAAGAGSVLATTSRRTGAAAAAALARALTAAPHRLHRWGDTGPNPYAAMLAWADAIVVTGDSVTMLSEAMATTAPVFIADPGRLGPRHRRLIHGLVTAGQARMLEDGITPFARTPLDEAGRVAAAIQARGWV